MDGVWQIFVALAAAMAMCPFAFFWGCLPCCQGGCDIDDGKPRTDPKNEGTWVPSGTWRGAGGVTWTFTANPGDDSGETWFFYGSDQTSAPGRIATTQEKQDWDNICNWYSNKTTAPSTLTPPPGPFSVFADSFDKRASRLPPDDAVVHFYTSINTNDPRSVKAAYFWDFAYLLSGSELTATSSAHDSSGGCVFSNATRNVGTVNGGATFDNPTITPFSGGNYGTVTGGAVFSDDSNNVGTINGGATFHDTSLNAVSGTVNDGATFNDSAVCAGTVNGGATLSGTCNNNGVINGGATLSDSALNTLTINGGATFNGSSQNGGTVNNGAAFNDTSFNQFGTVNGGATFSDSSSNRTSGRVNDGATFNDAACSTVAIGNFFASPCTRKFVAHPTDLPTCNGTAPDGCANSADTCGCG